MNNVAPEQLNTSIHNKSHLACCLAATFSLCVVQIHNCPSCTAKQTPLNTAGTHPEPGTPDKISKSSKSQTPLKSSSPPKSGLSFKSSEIIKPIHKHTSHFLIPPPPPIIPLGNFYAQGSAYTAGMPVEFMSLSELKREKDKLDKQIERAQKESEDQKSDFNAAKDRATQFESLYSEGVVSKKELETAKSSISEAQDGAQQAAENLNQLQIQLSQVNARLAHLNSSPAAHKTTTRESAGSNKTAGSTKTK